MWIEIEPGELLMYRIGLFFSRDQPAPEDEWVRAYLQEKGLEPRRQGTIERDGEAIDFLQFGQCYLGDHAPAIRELRLRGYERTALIQAVPQLLTDAGRPPEAEGIPPAELPAVIARVAERIHPEARLSAADDGWIGVEVDIDHLIAFFEEEREAGRPVDQE